VLLSTGETPVLPPNFLFFFAGAEVQGINGIPNLPIGVTS